MNPYDEVDDLGFCYWLLKRHGYWMIDPEEDVDCERTCPVRFICEDLDPLDARALAEDQHWDAYADEADDLQTPYPVGKPSEVIPFDDANADFAYDAHRERQSRKRVYRD